MVELPESEKFTSKQGKLQLRNIFRILLFIYENPGSSFSRIFFLLYISHITLEKYLDTLVQHGLLEIVPSKDKRRKRNYQITTKGLDFLKKAYELQEYLPNVLV